MHDLKRVSDRIINIISIVGFGKIAQALILLELIKCKNNNTVIISCVRGTTNWKKRQAFEDIASIIKDNNQNTIEQNIWLINHAEENFKSFYERCHQKEMPGIFIFNKDEELQEIINSSAVFGTAVGIEGLDDLMSKISGMKMIMKPCIFAFENSPQAVTQIAKKYQLSNKCIDLIHCPIDRVVVNRTFDDDKHEVTTVLGLDESKSIMIYDKYHLLGNLINISNNSCITITGESTLLAQELLKKRGCKNIPHKVLCQYVYSDREREYLINKSPSELITPKVAARMQELKPPIVLATLTAMMKKRGIYSTADTDALYKSLLDYYDNALFTVTHDNNEKISRIIHLDTHKHAETDRIGLIKSLKSYMEELSSRQAAEIHKYLFEKGYINVSLAKITFLFSELIRDMETIQ